MLLQAPKASSQVDLPQWSKQPYAHRNVCIDMSLQPLKWCAFVSCTEDLTKFCLSRYLGLHLLSRWRCHLPFPYCILPAGPAQEFWRLNHHTDVCMQLVLLCPLKTAKKPYAHCTSFSLCPRGFFQPKAPCSSRLPCLGGAAEGLTLNPCLQLPSSLLTFAYWIRINWNFQKGWYKSLSQVSRCGLTRVELC